MSRIGPFEILLDGWQDITEDSGPPPPYTLVSDDGGVLQLSPAIFRGGKWPDPSAIDLHELCLDLGRRKRFPEALSPRKYETAGVRWAGVSYQLEDRFMRVWYASDGKSFVLATLVPELGATERELGWKPKDFELNCETGEVRFKSSVGFSHVELSELLVRNAILCAVDGVSRF